MVEEVDSFEFGTQASLLFVGDVLERRAIWAEVEAYKFHDSFAADDVSAEVADDIDDVLSVVLQGTCFLEIALLPGLDDTHETAAIVVGSATYSALCSAHGQTWKNGLVLTVKHVELAVLIAAAAVVLVEALERVFDAGEIRNTAIYSL